MQIVLNDYVIILGWIFALAITLAVALPIFVWVANKILGEIDLLKEVKKKNLSAGMLLAGLVLGTALIIALAL